MKHGTVLLADSHSPMLEGVRSLLEERFESVVMVADESSLLPTAEKLQPDLVIVDVSFPMTGTKNAVVVLRERFPEMQLIVLSVHDEFVAVDRVLANGASAFVLKRCATTDLVPALEEVSAGRVYVSPAARMRRDGPREEDRAPVSRSTSEVGEEPGPGNGVDREQ
jgi:DNA-binding NarL/FixJ family response regulator